MKITEFIWNNGRFHKTLVTERGGEQLKSLQSMKIKKGKIFEKFCLKEYKNIKTRRNGFYKQQSHDKCLFLYYILF